MTNRLCRISFAISRAPGQILVNTFDARPDRDRRSETCNHPSFNLSLHVCADRISHMQIYNQPPTTQAPSVSKKAPLPMDALRPR